MTDNFYRVGGATGTATYDAVTINVDEDRITVLGDYQGDQSGFEGPRDSVYIAGMQADLTEGTISLIPPEDEMVYVTATEDDEIHIENGGRR